MISCKMDVNSYMHCHDIPFGQFWKKCLTKKKHFLWKCQRSSVFYNLKFKLLAMPLPLSSRLLHHHLHHRYSSFPSTSFILTFLWSYTFNNNGSKNQRINLFLLISSSQILLVPEKWNYSERQQLKEKFIHASNSHISVFSVCLYCNNQS